MFSLWIQFLWIVFIYILIYILYYYLFMHYIDVCYNQINITILPIYIICIPYKFYYIFACNISLNNISLNNILYNIDQYDKLINLKQSKKLNNQIFQLSTKQHSNSSSKISHIQIQIMNKSTNNFRRCQYCPHQIQQNKKLCCCQNQNKSVHSIKNKSKANSRGKSIKQYNKNKSTHIDQSNISYINSTLPITNNTAMPHFSSNILAQNSILRTQNDYLKRQLHSHTQYQPVSAFNYFKDQRNVSTLPNSENDTSRTYHLHDKLYASNRNLQQALIQLDTLSKSNKQLHQLNTKLQLQKQHLRITNEQLYEQSLKLKKKIKKLTKTIQGSPNILDVQKILQENTQIHKQNMHLRQQVQQLKDNLKRKQSKSRTIVQIQNLSPQWVAHTSTKINAIQKNIIKLQQQTKQNLHPNFYHNNSNISKQTKYSQQDVSLIKNQLIKTIKYLKLQSYSINFNSFLFQQILCKDSTSIMVLIKNLCQCLLQPVQVVYMQLQKDMDRTFKIYQNKFQKIVQKMENMVIKVQNQKLRNNNTVKNYI